MQRKTLRENALSMLDTAISTVERDFEDCLQALKTSPYNIVSYGTPYVRAGMKKRYYEAVRTRLLTEGDDRAVIGLIRSSVKGLHSEEATGLSPAWILFLDGLRDAKRDVVAHFLYICDALEQLEVLQTQNKIIYETGTIQKDQKVSAE